MKEKTQTELGKSSVAPNTSKISPNKGSASGLMPRVSNSDNSQLSNTPSKTLSSKPLGDWLGSLTTFKGFTGVYPDRELIDASWDVVVGTICPDKPQIIYDKKLGEYFLPCLLKEAPLVGNTLANR